MLTLTSRWAAACCAALALTPATALADNSEPEPPGSFDGLNFRTMPGNETPYTSARTYDMATEPFDSAVYTTREDRNQMNPNREQIACVHTNNRVIFGGKTSWVRFTAGSRGLVKLISANANFDVILHTYRSRPGQAVRDFGDLDDINCNGIRENQNGETDDYRFGPPTAGVRLEAGQSLYVQTLGVCALVPAPEANFDSCSNYDTNPPVRTGTNSVQVVFVPDNRDGDDVPDTLDACPDQDSRGRDADRDGCLDVDSDGDGVDDPVDACPATPGGTSDANPRDGCPDDTDGDGLADALDECPSQPGTVRGCPDRDGDGLVDTLDRCPTQPGTVRGCPDRDRDNIADRDDLCPRRRGTLRGCPVLRISTDFSARARRGQAGLRAVVLKVIGAPTRARVEVTCSRACRRQVRASRSSRRPVVFRYRFLPAGTRLFVRVTQREAVGYFVQYTITRNNRRRGTPRCLFPGSRRPRACG